MTNAETQTFAGLHHTATWEQKPLLSLAEELVETARERIAACGELDPLINLLRHDPLLGPEDYTSLIIPPVDLCGAADPDDWPHRLPAAFARTRTLAYVLASEGWMVSGPESTLPEGHMVHADDRRKHVLVLSGETCTGDRFFGAWPIKNGAALDGAEVLAVWNIHDPGGEARTGGGLTGLLPDLTAQLHRGPRH